MAKSRPILEQYKIVTVIVTLHGPLTSDEVQRALHGDLPKTVLLKTAIYRQAYGPDATGLRVYTDAQPSGTQTFSTGPLKARVTISSVDAPNVDYVRFIVYANNGSQIAGTTVSNYPSSDSRFPALVYEWQWTDSLQAPDGAYTFAAVAVAAGSQQTGAMWQKPIYLDHKIPDAPKWATNGVVAGANAVMVTWQSAQAGDLRCYEVQRTASTGSTTFDNLPRWSTTLVDRRQLQAGVTYSYVVRAWDDAGQAGPWSEPITATPTSAAGSAPAATGGVTASQVIGKAGDESTRQRAVSLGWPASVDDHDGGTVAYYLVYRRQVDPVTTFVDAGVDWSSPLKVIAVTTRYGTYSTADASVDWRSLYEFSVTTVDAALYESGRTAAVPVEVLLPTGTFYLTVRATADPSLIPRRQKWYVRLSIVSLDTGEVYPKPWGITQIDDKLYVNGTKPYVQTLTIFGRYQVVASFYDNNGTFKGTSSVFVDLAETREATVPYQAP